MRKLKLRAPRSLTGPGEKILMETNAKENKLDVFHTLMRLLGDAGFVPGDYEVTVLMGFTLAGFAELIPSVYLLMKQLVGEKEWEVVLIVNTAIAPALGATGSSQYQSTSSNHELSSSERDPVSSSDDERPTRTSLGPAGLHALRENGARAANKAVHRNIPTTDTQFAMLADAIAALSPLACDFVSQNDLHCAVEEIYRKIVLEPKVNHRSGNMNIVQQGGRFDPESVSCRNRLLTLMRATHQMLRWNRCLHEDCVVRASMPQTTSIASQILLRVQLGTQ